MPSDLAVCDCRRGRKLVAGGGLILFFCCGVGITRRYSDHGSVIFYRLGLPVRSGPWGLWYGVVLSGCTVGQAGWSLPPRRNTGSVRAMCQIAGPPLVSYK